MNQQLLDRLQVNCRTCAHATAREDGTWFCEYWKAAIPEDAQRKGCEHHVIHPDLVDWLMKDSPDGVVGVYEIDGKEVKNGAHGDGVFASDELLANPAACASGDEHISELRKTFDAKVIQDCPMPGEWDWP